MWISIYAVNMNKKKYHDLEMLLDHHLKKMTMPLFVAKGENKI